MCTHTCTHALTHTHMHALTHTHTHAHTHACTHAHTHTHICKQTPMPYALNQHQCSFPHELSRVTKRTSNCLCFYLSSPISSLHWLPVLGCVDLASYDQNIRVCLCVCVYALRIVSMDKISCFINTSIIFISDLKWHTSETRCPCQP